MIIKITDKYYADGYENIFELWYKIETENEDLIEEILIDSHKECEECEFEISVYEIFETKLWDNNIMWSEFKPNMEFEIEYGCTRIR